MPLSRLLLRIRLISCKVFIPNQFCLSSRPTRRGSSLVPLLALAFAGHVGAQQYTVADLGSAEVNSLSNQGQVAGFVLNDSVGFGAARWNGTIPTILKLVNGETGSSAAGINDAGSAVGGLYLANGDPRAIIWQDDIPRVLGLLPNAFSSNALGINDVGQIVGLIRYGSGSGNYTATVWNDSKPTDLGTLGGPTSEAVGINSAGQIVGTADLAPNLYHATLWQNGQTTDLGTLNNSFNYLSIAVHINAAGDIAGYSYDINSNSHATLWNGTHALDLGTLGGTSSNAYGINSKGVIVGSSQIAGNAVYHATLWPNATTRIDLNEHIDPKLLGSLTLNGAAAINDDGWIAVNGTQTATGDDHGYLLIPLPSAALTVRITSLLGMVVNDDPSELRTGEVAAALEAYRIGQIGTACKSFATFIANVRAQSDLDRELVHELISDAVTLRDLIGCPLQ